MLNLESVYEGAYTLFVVTMMYTTCIHFDQYRKDMIRLMQQMRKLPKITLYVATHAVISFSLLKEYIRNYTNSLKNSNVYMEEHPEKHYIEIGYTFRDEMYKIRVPTKKGPKRMLMADADNQPVSDILSMYLGPMENCHSSELTPADFGWKELVISLTDGSEKVFRENEPIKF